MGCALWYTALQLVHAAAAAAQRGGGPRGVSSAITAPAGASSSRGRGGGGDDEVVGGDATLALYQGAGRLFDVTLPIVGAIQGPAVGGGLGLAMVPDIRITCPDARFSANFASLGIHQGFGMSVTLPQLLGPSRAAQVLYSAKRYKGEEAVAIGLADECVPSEQVRERALEVATEIAANAPLALRAIKSTLRLGLSDRVREITQREAQLQAELSASDDAKEGIAAVGERRAGNFKGK